MKMPKEEYQKMLEAYKENIDKIKEYAPRLKESGRYKSFERRLSADCKRAFIGIRYTCDVYYDKYGLNDDHIFTASRKALKELNVL